MAKVINLNQYREQRERQRRAAEESDYAAKRRGERPIRSLEELEDLRREIEDLRRERPLSDDSPEAG